MSDQPAAIVLLCAVSVIGGGCDWTEGDSLISVAG